MKLLFGKIRLIQPSSQEILALWSFILRQLLISFNNLALSELVIFTGLFLVKSGSQQVRFDTLSIFLGIPSVRTLSVANKLRLMESIECQLKIDLVTPLIQLSRGIYRSLILNGINFFEKLFILIEHVLLVTKTSFTFFGDDGFFAEMSGVTGRFTGTGLSRDRTGQT